MPQIAQQDYIRIDWGGTLDTPPSEAAKQELLSAYKQGTIFDVIVKGKYEDDTYYSRITGASKDAGNTIRLLVFADDGVSYIYEIGTLE